jgi:hypothetical protein
VRQRQEDEVHKLLEKLQPSSISLDQSKIGTIDNASEAVKKEEEKADLEEWMSQQRKKKKRSKSRGKSSAGNEVRVKTQHIHEKMREKKRQELEGDFKKKK